MKNNEFYKYCPIEQNIVLINKIYESFEALEETLGMLHLEEPLFMTYAAKKSFAKKVYKNKSEKKLLKQ